MPVLGKCMANNRLPCECCKTRRLERTINQETDLEFNADYLGMYECCEFIQALRDDRHTRMLVIRSEFLRTKGYISDNLSSSSSSSSASASIQNEPAVHRPAILNLLVGALSKCMSCSFVLSNLQLQGLPLTSKNVKTLARAVQNCESLQNLTLTNFDLFDTGLKILYNSLVLHTGLKTLDLTGCAITKNGARIIAKVIRAQRIVRYNEMRKQSMNFELNKIVLSGIRHITMNDNPDIGDDGFIAVVHELMDDLWVTELEAQNCGLTAVSAKAVLKLIKINKVIKILNINQNKIDYKGQENINTLLLKRVQHESCEQHESRSDGNSKNCHEVSNKLRANLTRPQVFPQIKTSRNIKFNKNKTKPVVERSNINNVVETVGTVETSPNAGKRGNVIKKNSDKMNHDAINEVVVYTKTREYVPPSKLLPLVVSPSSTQSATPLSDYEVSKTADIVTNKNIGVQTNLKDLNPKSGNQFILKRIKTQQQGSASLKTNFINTNSKEHNISTNKDTEKMHRDLSPGSRAQWIFHKILERKAREQKAAATEPVTNAHNDSDGSKATNSSTINNIEIENNPTDLDSRSRSRSKRIEPSDKLLKRWAAAVKKAFDDPFNINDDDSKGNKPSTNEDTEKKPVDLSPESRAQWKSCTTLGHKPQEQGSAVDESAFIKADKNFLTVIFNVAI